MRLFFAPAMKPTCSKQFLFTVGVSRGLVLWVKLLLKSEAHTLHLQICSHKSKQLLSPYKGREFNSSYIILGKVVVEYSHKRTHLEAGCTSTTVPGSRWGETWLPRKSFHWSLQWWTLLWAWRRCWARSSPGWCTGTSVGFPQPQTGRLWPGDSELSQWPKLWRIGCLPLLKIS